MLHECLICSPFLVAVCGEDGNALLNDYMAQWAKLHKMSSAAMKDVIVRLWPTKTIISGYFGLVWRLAVTVPCTEAMKRSACIEGP